MYKAYSYPNLTTSEGREICFLPENHKLQQKVNALFRDYSPTTLVQKGVVKVLARKGSPLIFTHPDFPEHVFKAVSNSCTSTKQVNGTYHRLDGSTTITIDRVPMAHGLRDIIEKEQLNCLYVPKKSVAKLPYARGELQDRNYVVLAEKLDLTSPEETKKSMDEMDPEELKIMIRQLYTLMLKSGYVDGHGHNFAFIQSGPHAGKLAIYDTESLATWDCRDTEIGLRNLYSLDRDNHLSCASYAITESTRPFYGLPIHSAVIGPIAREFKCRSLTERVGNLMKAGFLVSSAILVPILAACVQAKL